MCFLGALLLGPIVGIPLAFVLYIQLGFSRWSPEIVARLDHLGLLKGAEVYRTNRNAIVPLADAHRD